MNFAIVLSILLHCISVLLASEQGELACISCVQCKSAIYIFICMYTFFYGTFMRASTNNLDSAMNCTFHAVDSNIAHTPWKKWKQIKEMAETGERSQTE